MSSKMIKAMLIALARSASAHNDHGSGGMKCPGSPAGFHAWLAIEASFTGACAHAKEEILARVAGQDDNTWDDPHGDGKYTLISDTDEGVTVDRLSSNGVFTDRVLFTFNEDGSTCTVMGCSESQGSSGGDQSTNLCNSWNLVCTKEQECCAVKHDFTSFTYSVHSKSSGASSNGDVCLGGMGGSGGGFGGERQTQCLTAGPGSTDTGSGNDAGAGTNEGASTAAPDQDQPTSNAPAENAHEDDHGHDHGHDHDQTTNAPVATTTNQDVSAGVSPVSHAHAISCWVAAVAVLF